MKNKIIITFLRICLGGLFIYASLDKIAHPDLFAKNVGYFRILPLKFTNLVAIVLPWIEFISGLFLALGIFSSGAVLVLTVLLVIFLFAGIQAGIRGIDLQCGCFSTTGKVESAWWVVLRDIPFLIIAFILLLQDKFKFALDNLLKPNSK